MDGDETLPSAVQKFVDAVADAYGDLPLDVAGRCYGLQAAVFGVVAGLCIQAGVATAPPDWRGIAAN